MGFKGLIGEGADSPSRDQSSPLHDQLFGRDGMPLCYQCKDMEATIQGHVTQHNNNFEVCFEWPYYHQLVCTCGTIF